MGGKGGGDAAEQARRDEEARQARIREGTTRINGIFEGFGDNFFNSRKQAYIDYANPQLEDQYGKTQKELTFALDRAGLLDSSVRGQKTGELQQLYDTNKQQIADQALAYEGQTRNSIEDARGNLISTLNATGDAEGAASAALARSQALSQPTAYSPLSNLFVDFTSALGTQYALDRANSATNRNAAAPTLFPQRSSAVKVT